MVAHYHLVWRGVAHIPCRAGHTSGSNECITPINMETSFTLFVTIVSLLLYRTIDLLSLREKVRQLLNRVGWDETTRLKYSTMRRACATFGPSARSLLWMVQRLQHISKDFPLLLMVIYLLAIFLIGVSGLLSGTAAATYVVIGVTFVTSLFSASVSYMVEHLRRFI